MIHISLQDAGTLPVVVPSDTPGCDDAYWREADFEINVAEDGRTRTNVAMQSTGTVDVRPYPIAVQRQVYVDNSPIYERRLDDGIEFRLHHLDQISNELGEISGGDSALDLDSEPEIDRGAGRLNRELTWQEIQQTEIGGLDHLRLPFLNETGGTRLEPPLTLTYHGLRGAAYALELVDNSLFAPFDLRYPDRYTYWLDDGARVLTGSEARDQGYQVEYEHVATFLDGGRYRLYLRPRTWRYLAQVLAHYAFISWFEYVPHDETIIRAHLDRPPFYPYRHDIITNTQYTPYQNFYGEPRSYDPGIDWQWTHSSNAAEMRREIVEATFETICLVKVLIGTEDADVTVWRYPPEIGEIVLGIGRIDQATGQEDRIWVKQAVSADATYPATVLGQFFVPFSVYGP